MNAHNLTVEIKPILTIDHDTAQTILGLLEMYCRANNQRIKTFYVKERDSAKPREINFVFEEDNPYEDNDETEEE